MDSSLSIHLVEQWQLGSMYWIDLGSEDCKGIVIGGMMEEEVRPFLDSSGRLLSKGGNGKFFLVRTGLSI